MTRLLPILLLLSFLNPASAAQLAEATIAPNLTLPYYVSAPPGAPVKTILIAIQGYVRDANRTYAAAAQAAAAQAAAAQAAAAQAAAAQAAAANASLSASTLIVAPIFQVPASKAGKCNFPGVPTPTATDAIWKCATWSDGSPAINASMTSFQALDSLLARLTRQYPAARQITVAGFSAGGQYVQRYAAFSNPPPAIPIRYVISDPSGFLYFDPIRPLPIPATCPTYNNWKFGTQNLPATLHRTAAAARAAYAAANITYLEAALDTGGGPYAAYDALEKSCGAEAQGHYRLDRGQNYAVYDAAHLAHGAHHLIIVPGCAHLVTCVFPSPAARAALFGPF